MFWRLVEENVDFPAAMKTQHQLEDELELVVHQIQQAAWGNTQTLPQIGHTPIMKEMRELVYRNRRTRKSWQNKRASEDKTLFNFLTNELKELIKKVKNETISRYLQSLTAKKG